MYNFPLAEVRKRKMFSHTLLGRMILGSMWVVQAYTCIAHKKWREKVL
jgi:hypothetical protein